MLTAPELSKASGVRHGFFTRRGGVSDGLFASLNCGFGSGDDPARVAANRDAAAEILGVGAGNLVTVYQTHSADVIVAEMPWKPADAPKADAIVTRTPGLAVAVLTADCAPVLLADAEAGVVGAAHAGWRGAIGGVIEATVAGMVSLGARADSTVAVVGPCILQSSYEVGPEFEQTFLADDPANARFFAPSSRAGHAMFDLQGYAAMRLERAGLGAVERLSLDTCGDEDRFFSYRRAVKRGEKQYGRGISAVAIGR